MIDTGDFDGKTYQLYAGINKSTRYHNRRRMFYERWNAITISLASAALAVGSVFQWQEPNAMVGAVMAAVAALGVIDTALGTAKKANLHNELSTQFAMLEKRFAIGRSLDDDGYRQVIEARLDIESREPPTLYLLNELATMEFERSVGACDTPPPKVGVWRRVTVQLLSHQHYAERRFPGTDAEPEEMARVPHPE